MKNIAFILFFSLILFSCEKEKDLGQQIYFNTFESQSDTVGWVGYGAILIDMIEIRKLNVNP